MAELRIDNADVPVKRPDVLAVVRERAHRARGLQRAPGDGRCWSNSFGYDLDAAPVGPKIL